MSNTPFIFPFSPFLSLSPPTCPLPNLSCPCSPIPSLPFFPPFVLSTAALCCPPMLAQYPRGKHTYYVYCIYIINPHDTRMKPCKEIHHTRNISHTSQLEVLQFQLAVVHSTCLQLISGLVSHLNDANSTLSVIISMQRIWF